jgi:hypothetical protein
MEYKRTDLSCGRCCRRQEFAWVSVEQCYTCSNPFGYPSPGQPFCYTCGEIVNIHPRCTLLTKAFCDECYLEVQKGLHHQSAGEIVSIILGSNQPKNNLHRLMF